MQNYARSRSSLNKDESNNNKSYYNSYLKKLGESKGAYGFQHKDNNNQETNKKIGEFMNNFSIIDEKHKKIMAENRKRRENMERKLKQEEETKFKLTQEKLELRKLSQQEAYIKNLKDNNKFLISRMNENDTRKMENKENLPAIQKPHSAKPSRISLTPLNRFSESKKKEIGSKDPIEKKQPNLNPIKKDKDEFKNIAQHYTKKSQDNYENLVDEYLFSINNSAQKKFVLEDDLIKNDFDEFKDFSLHPKPKDKKFPKKDAQNTFYSELERLNNRKENSFLENLIGYESEESESNKKRKPLIEIDQNKKLLMNKSPLDIKKTLYFESSDEKVFGESVENNYKMENRTQDEFLDESRSSRFKANLLNKVKNNRTFSIRKAKTSDSSRESQKKVNKELITINQEEIELQKELKDLNQKKKEIKNSEAIKSKIENKYALMLQKLEEESLLSKLNTEEIESKKENSEPSDQKPTENKAHKVLDNTNLNIPEVDETLEASFGYNKASEGQYKLGYSQKFISKRKEYLNKTKQNNPVIKIEENLKKVEEENKEGKIKVLDKENLRNLLLE